MITAVCFALSVYYIPRIFIYLFRNAKFPQHRHFIPQGFPLDLQDSVEILQYDD